MRAHCACLACLARLLALLLRWLTAQGKQEFGKARTPPGTVGIRAVNAADELPPLQDPPNLQGGGNFGGRPAWGQQGAGRPSPGGGGRPSPGGGAGGGRPSPGGAGGGGRGAVGDGSNDRKVFVGGLPFDADEGRVRGLFEGKGSIERVTMLNDPVTQMFKGVAFVTLSDAGEANKACEALNGFAHAGRKLRVNMAASRRQ